MITHGRSRVGMLAALAAAVLAGCTSSGGVSPSRPHASMSAGLSAVTPVQVRLTGARPLTAAEQDTTLRVLRARLAALDAPAVVTASAGGATVTGPDVSTAEMARLAVRGELEMRPVAAVVPRHGASGGGPLTGDIPPSVMKLLGQCPAASVAGADRWTVACDANQENSFLLAPSRLVTPDLWSATATIDASGTSTGAWLVDLAFRPPDQARFTELSRESLGKQAAFVVDGVVLSAPVFQAVITGDAQISGDLDEQGARDLAAVLTGGVLPVALRVS